MTSVVLLKYTERERYREGEFSLTVRFFMFRDINWNTENVFTIEIFLYLRHFILKTLKG